jgi:hypothetical protein
MAGYIGSKASVVSSGAERKKTFAITTTTTVLSGLSYTPQQVHVFHNGVRLVDGTDFTATDGASLTLTSAAQSGDEVVVISYATFQVSDTVSASAGGTFTGDVSVTGAFTSLGIDDNAAATAMTLDASGNVGIGTTSPSAALTVSGGDIKSTGSARNQMLILERTDAGNDYEWQIQGRSSLDSQAFAIVDNKGGASAERMRIDASGNLLVGKTAANIGVTSGFEYNAALAVLYATRAGTPAAFNRLSSNGTLVDLRKDGTSVGSIGTAGDLYIGHSVTGIKFVDSQFGIAPFRVDTQSNYDNALDLGLLNVRWDDIYATNATIQTSDRNEKQDIDVLSAAETAVAQACKGLMRKFRWKDAVAEKGDDARIHFGIIAQDLQDAFTAQGLDAGNYAMFISGTWWEADRIIPAVEAVAEELDEDGNVIVEAVEAVAEQTVTDTFETLEEAPEGATERTRLGVRYPELLAFIIGAM